MGDKFLRVDGHIDGVGECRNAAGGGRLFHDGGGQSRGVASGATLDIEGDMGISTAGSA